MDKHGHNFVIFSQATGQTWNHTSAYHLSTLEVFGKAKDFTVSYCLKIRSHMSKGKGQQVMEFRLEFQLPDRKDD